MTAPSATGEIAPPRAILFDWDSTLVESWPAILDALNHTFRAFEHPEWTLAEAQARVQHSLRDSFPAIFGDRWEEASETYYGRYDQIHAEMIKPLPTAAAALARLAERGIYLGVVSNKRGDYLRQEAERLGWTRFFGGIVGALDAPRDKPDPAPVTLALAAGGLEPAPDMWFVGDADVDLACAANAGLVGVLMSPEEPVGETVAAHPPHHRFADCEVLCNFIENL